MSQPKQHCEAQPVHLCRRATQRRYLLRNDKSGETKNDAGYIFGLATNKCGQNPHAVMTMSNHVHIFQTDTTGKRSKFMQLFHGLLAKVINRRLDRTENLWSHNHLDLNTILLKKSLLSLNYSLLRSKKS